MDVDRVGREADARIVYCGPPGAGKTTNLKQLHQTLAPETRGKLISSVADSERAFAFDFLSVELGEIRGYSTRLHLYALPRDPGEEGRRRILRGADGVVLVADSGPDRLEADRTALERVTEGLEAAGRDPREVVMALQYNKRDLDGALPLDDLEAALNPAEAPAFEAVARRGEGVVETVEEVAVRVLRAFDPGREGG